MLPALSEQEQDKGRGRGFFRSGKWDKGDKDNLPCLPLLWRYSLLTPDHSPIRLDTALGKVPLSGIIIMREAQSFVTNQYGFC